MNVMLFTTLSLLCITQTALFSAAPAQQTLDPFFVVMPPGAPVYDAPYYPPDNDQKIAAPTLDAAPLRRVFQNGKFRLCKNSTKEPAHLFEIPITKLQTLDSGTLNEILAAAGFDINSTNESKQPLIMQACIFNDLASFQVILLAGATFGHDFDSRGSSSLVEACKHREHANIEIINAIIEVFSANRWDLSGACVYNKGTDAEKLQWPPQTPLWMILHANRTDIAKLLLDNHAPLAQNNADAYYALMGNISLTPATKKLLKKYGCYYSYRESDCCPPCYCCPCCS